MIRSLLLSFFMVKFINEVKCAYKIELLKWFSVSNFQNAKNFLIKIAHWTNPGWYNKTMHLDITLFHYIIGFFTQLHFSQVIRLVVLTQ